ncbi:MAG: glycine cleavage system aminomethyltransferase GcvT [Armatimonadota bacterium]|nr:glycine cleavage system aminomethyltransferase GcvT [Armatimonadota bacterium]MDR7531933.1 glycine cleavage system aminomethyltransferase GcvT [Armatimonadota bacterium]
MTGALRRTPLYVAHRAAGARLVPFAGWEMPVQYAGVMEEHIAVRGRAGLFDVSHMGEIRVEGPGALDVVQRVITNDASRLSVGRGLYTPMCLSTGGIVDDVTVFRVGEDAYLFIVNAARRERDVAWIAEHAPAGRVVVRDISDETALLALQGPRAGAILTRLADADVAALPPFHARDGVLVAGVAVWVSRTGYTGEDGFELAMPWDEAPLVWHALLEAGRREGLVPAGLGARDTLRLEAAFMLYGNDIDETTTPLEAPLAWTVKFDKGAFIGREALLRQRVEGVTRRLVGFEVTARAIARPHHAIWADGERIGTVTSGTFAPSLQRAIGLGYVPVAYAAVGTALRIEIRGEQVPAQVVRLPFYRRAQR